MTTIQKLDPLAETLGRFEKHLELPHVSGELDSWSDEALQLFEESDRNLRETLSGEHPRIFETIRKSRSNLMQQVDKLAQEDGQLLEQLPSLRSQFQQFGSTIHEDTLAAQQFEAARERLVNAGLSFIIRIRKQQAAVDTWMGEAIQRDNGAGH